MAKYWSYMPCASRLASTLTSDIRDSPRRWDSRRDPDLPILDGNCIWPFFDRNCSLSTVWENSGSFYRKCSFVCTASSCQWLPWLEAMHLPGARFLPTVVTSGWCSITQSSQSVSMRYKFKLQGKLFTCATVDYFKQFCAILKVPMVQIKESTN